MDREFIEYLKIRKLDVCGECGEFHTFLTSGTLFRGRIEITNAEVTDGDAYRFLNMRNFSVLVHEKEN
jgi:diphthamide synthase (EF-2-diphthine--ammonia ligase)